MTQFQKLALAIFCLIISGRSNSFAQSGRDSSQLNEVVVKAYFSDRPILAVPSSVSVITPAVLENQTPASLVPAFNTVPGVRMEERSPGSYRLSLRGSLLRSPFGIRNVKIYMDDFMLTDASGNTYLNILDAGSAGMIEVLKGPEGSIFGANSGGVVVLNTSRRDSSLLTASITGGSYGLFHEKAMLWHESANFKLGINQALQKSDGYRENSALDRKYVHIAPQWSYSPRASLRAIGIYSDLDYQTPGGLNAQQFELDPRLARPRAGNIPGAMEQRAQIFNKTLLGGLSHHWKISDNLRHVIAFTASSTDYRNPFITNYETREEASLGLRTYLEFRRDIAQELAIQVGGEAQQTSLDIDRFDNLAGVKGPPQKSDDMKARQGFLFARITVKPLPNLLLESAISVNKYAYQFESSYPAFVPESNRNFNAELMPRFAASYTINSVAAIRASVSRGYSPPTLEEVNPSTESINTSIQAEKGWNHELGFRLSLLNNRIYWDGAFFLYRLKDAIVREVQDNDITFYINAGGTDQRGIESELVFRVIPYQKDAFIKSLQLRNAYTFSNFKFNNYNNNGIDLSGNWLTGVPRNVVVSSVDIQLPAGLSFFAQHNYTSSIPLNDANSVYAQKYNLLNAKLSWSQKFTRNRISLFAGADNLLNEKYSLGNDLNAAANRYFNAAAPLNFYGGLSYSY